ncbi:creatininase family protein [bacterium]|nr:creatininase family protein [bacterium]
MSTTSVQLSAVPSSGAWHSYRTTEMEAPTTAVAILPIYGLGDYGLGLAMDIDEVMGSAVLATALDSIEAGSLLRVLPPLRLGLSPYHPSVGKIGPDHLRDTLMEISEGVAQSGVQNLLFWSINPWNAEIVDTASRDIRVSHGLRTYVIDSSGVGLSLHPASADRSRAQLLGSHLCVKPPTGTSNDVPVDTEFRPGNWANLPSVESTTTETGESVLRDSANQLAELLGEIVKCSLSATVTANGTTSDFSINASHLYPGRRRSRYLPALNRTELDGLKNKKESLVIIPIGATEQHGPHLPLGVDSMIAEVACDGLYDRLPEAVWFGPTLAFGKSNEHVGFPGTLSLSAQSLRQIVKSVVGNLHSLGFRQFAILNTHGGNSSVLTYTLREIQHELNVRAGMLRLKASDELDPQERAWGFHAGEWETSVMLAIAPDTVQMDRAICHYPAFLEDPGKLRPENAPATHSWVTRDIAPDGVMGDATKATAEKGRRWLETALDQMAAQIRDLL